MEKLFVTASNYLKKERHQTKFFALRYGNVLGSSGSVIPKFIKQIKNKEKITITDPNMTRFSISMDKALDFILHATEIAKGSEIFIPKLRAYSIDNLKEALFELLGKTNEEIIENVLRPPHPAGFISQSWLTLLLPRPSFYLRQRLGDADEDHAFSHAYSGTSPLHHQLY